MKFKKMAAVALAGVTACATVPAAVPVFAADGYDHEAIENAGDITITMMVSGLQQTTTSKQNSYRHW